MKFMYFAFLSVFGLTYLAYMTWLTGYRAGYSDGNDKAWSNARQALMKPAESTKLHMTYPEIIPVEKRVELNEAPTTSL